MSTSTDIMARKERSYMVCIDPGQVSLMMIGVPHITESIPILDTLSYASGNSRLALRTAEGVLIIQKAADDSGAPLIDIVRVDTLGNRVIYRGALK